MGILRGMATVPATMRASVLLQPGKLVVEERPVPVPDSDQVLIKVLSVGVCGSDVHYYKTGRIGRFVVEKPLILGHEVSGQIVAVGSDVARERIGERVAIEPQRPCRVCRYCRSGRYNLCPKMEFYGTPPIDGAFCEYITIQSDFAFAIPDSVSPHAGALIEPLSVGIAAAQKGGIERGSRVLIAGGGPIGIIAAQVARAYGASQVALTELNPLRREMALKYGVTRVIDPLDPGEPFESDVFIDASGAVPAIEAGLATVRPGGSVVLVGSAETFPLPVPRVAMNEIVVTGTFRYTNTWPIGIQMVTDGDVELDSLVTHVYGLSQVEEALNAEASPSAFKRIVIPSIVRVENPADIASVAAR